MFMRSRLPHVMALILIGWIGPLPAQTDLTPYAGNPILGFGPPGSWDAGWVAFGHTVFHDGTYYTFFAGSPDLSTHPEAIGYATSTDGISFTEYAGNPVLESDGTGFDAYFLSEPVPVVEGSTWVLYYNASAVYSTLPGPAIGRATAPGPDGPWTPGDDPVLETGSSNEWDSQFVIPNSVIATDSGYVMYYSGSGGFLPRAMVGMATSPDGINWTKYDDPATTDPPYAESDPVLPYGEAGEWDSGYAFECTVWRSATGWAMYYTGSPSNFTDEQIGYATSADGIHWTKYAGNPILGSTESWASLWVMASSMVRIDSTYYLYYTGLTSDVSAQIGLATSPPTSIAEDPGPPRVPSGFSISQNVPNPFNPSTTIEYTVPDGRGTIPVEISIYDLRGRRVRRLVDAERSPGTHRVHWDGRDDAGAAVPSGIYLYRIVAGGFGAVRKMALWR